MSAAAPICHVFAAQLQAAQSTGAADVGRSTTNRSHRDDKTRNPHQIRSDELLAAAPRPKPEARVRSIAALAPSKVGFLRDSFLYRIGHGSKNKELASNNAAREPIGEMNF